MKNFFRYFSKLEMALWSASVFLIIASFLVFDRTNYLTLIASVIGVTSLIFNAKGNPLFTSLFFTQSITKQTT